MIKDGVYFQLPEADYLAEERLSKSSIKRLRISPADYWSDSHLNPDRKRKETSAMAAGRAYHCARLEPERFARTYVRELSKAEMPEGTLFTGAEMKDWLKDHDLKQTGAVAEQAARIAEADPSQPLWHNHLIEWEASLQPGQIALSPSLYDEIVTDMKRMHSMPVIRSLLSNGAAEVSVFWTDANGIKMKARFDYLKPDRWIEVKTFSNPNGKNLSQCLTDAMQYNRYYIDAAAYMEAAEAVRSGVLEIMDEATDAERALIGAIQARATELRCHFIFQQTGGVPNILDREWLFFDGASESAVDELIASGATEDRIARAKKMQAMATREKTVIYIKGRMEISAAKRDWLAMNEIYEPGHAWLPFQPSGTFTDADFSQRFLEEAI